MLEKVKEKLNNSEFWKGEKTRLCYYALGAVAGVTCMYVYNGMKHMQFALGLQTVHNKGYLIFTKPTEDGSIPKLDIKEWLGEIKEIH